MKGFVTMKKEFYFPSASGDTKIHAVIYIPEGKIQAILQIAHGMVEYIERYEQFALYLNSKGILVTGNDHLGHGSSVSSKDNYGYLCEKNGNKAVLYDIRRLTDIIKKSYPNIPYFLLGHSMGSFYARQYLIDFGKELDGAIIMGTGFQPPFLIKAGKNLSKGIAHFKGWHCRCPLINNIAFGSYNKRFRPTRTSKDWLTKDTAIIDKYVTDERCNFMFTLNAFYNMFCGMERLYKKNLLEKMPKNLPVFFVSGTDDPVGDFSKGVIRAVDSFHNVGMKNVKVKLYEGDRHEILNETDREIIYQDLYDWIYTHSVPSEIDTIYNLFEL